jgi:hypothetical protein
VAGVDLGSRMIRSDWALDDARYSGAYYRHSLLLGRKVVAPVPGIDPAYRGFFIHTPSIAGKPVRVKSPCRRDKRKRKTGSV